MPEDRQGTIVRVNGKNYGTGTGGLGSANSTTTANCYASPLDDPSDIPLWHDYLTKTMRGDEDIDGDETWADRTFQDNITANNVVIAEVATGGGGLPTSPWTPNLASPGMESMGSGDVPGVSRGVDPTEIPDLGWSEGAAPGYAGVENSNPPGAGGGSTLGPNGTVSQPVLADISVAAPLGTYTVDIQQYPQNVGTDALGSSPSDEESGDLD